jgi:3-oxoacyl-(acyl-carrier-protein) synthase
MGIVAPNGIGLDAFEHAIKNGISGIRHNPELERLHFSCQISGTPEVSNELALRYFSELELRNFNATGILYGVIAAMDAWNDAGLTVPDTDQPDWDSGTIFGTGTSGIDKFRESIYKIDDLQTRRLGSTAVAQTMEAASARMWAETGLGTRSPRIRRRVQRVPKVYCSPMKESSLVKPSACCRAVPATAGHTFGAVSMR